MRVGGPQQPVQVDVPDDADPDGRVATGGRQTRQQALVVLAGRLLRVELDHDVDPRQRPVEQARHHAHAVHLVTDRVARRGHDEEPVIVGDPELAAQLDALVGCDVDGGIVGMDAW